MAIPFCYFRQIKSNLIFPNPTKLCTSMQSVADVGCRVETKSNNFKLNRMPPCSLWRGRERPRGMRSSGNGATRLVSALRSNPGVSDFRFRVSRIRFRVSDFGSVARQRAAERNEELREWGDAPRFSTQVRFSSQKLPLLLLDSRYRS